MVWKIMELKLSFFIWHLNFSRFFFLLLIFWTPHLMRRIEISWITHSKLWRKDRTVWNPNTERALFIFICAGHSESPRLLPCSQIWEHLNRHTERYYLYYDAEFWLSSLLDGHLILRIMEPLLWKNENYAARFKRQKHPVLCFAKHCSRSSSTVLRGSRDGFPGGVPTQSSQAPHFSSRISYAAWLN